MQENTRIFQASILVAISAILYGFLGFLGTMILREHFSVVAMLFWRFFIAGAWMLLFIMIKHLRRPAVRSMDKSALIWMFSLGAIAYAGSSFFYFIASRYVGTGLAMVIFFSYPVLVALFSWLIHRKNITLATILALLAMIIGLYLLQYSSFHQFNAIGIGFGVAAAVCYATYVIGSKNISAVIIDSNLLTMIVCFSCASLFLALSWMNHSFAFPHALKSWIFISALGIIATALPIQLMLLGLRHVTSMRASILSVLEPLVTVGVGIVMLNESLSHWQIIGGVIILISALTIQFARDL